MRHAALRGRTAGRSRPYPGDRYRSRRWRAFPARQREFRSDGHSRPYARPYRLLVRPGRGGILRRYLVRARLRPHLRRHGRADVVVAQALARAAAGDRVYCGHEYTQSNARFALTVEPANQALAARAAEVDAKRAAGQPTIPSTIGAERATNPSSGPTSPRWRQGWGLPAPIRSRSSPRRGCARTSSND